MNEDPAALKAELEVAREENELLRRHVLRAYGWLHQLQGDQRPDEQWLEEMRRLTGQWGPILGNEFLNIAQ